MKRIGIVGVYLDTRTNNEDMAITPYLSLFYVNEEFEERGRIVVAGISITFLYYALGFGLTCNYPKGMKKFRVITRRTKNKTEES